MKDQNVITPIPANRAEEESIETQCIRTSTGSRVGTTAESAQAAVGKGSYLQKLGESLKSTHWNKSSRSGPVFNQYLSSESSEVAEFLKDQESADGPRWNEAGH